MRVAIHIVIFLFVAVSAEAQQYGQIMSSAVRRAFGGRQFQNYVWLSYPTDNYGVLTMFQKQRFSKNPLDPKRFICDTWSCIGVSDEQIPQPTVSIAEKEKWLTVNSFAAKGSGAPVSFSADEKRQLTLGFVLPEILRILNVTASADVVSEVVTDVSIDRAIIRNVRKEPLQKYLENLASSSERRKAFEQGRLVLVGSDVVVEGFAVTLDVSKVAEGSLKAALAKNIDKVVGKDANLTMKIRGGTDGKYQLLPVQNPLIIAVLPLGQPGPKKLGAGEPSVNLQDWNPEQNVPLGKR